MTPIDPIIIKLFVIGVFMFIFAKFTKILMKSAIRMSGHR